MDKILTAEDILKYGIKEEIEFLLEQYDSSYNISKGLNAIKMGHTKESEIFQAFKQYSLPNYFPYKNIEELKEALTDYHKIREITMLVSKSGPKRQKELANTIDQLLKFVIG